MVLWDDVLDEIAPEYPAVTVDKQHIDAISMNFVRMPETFDIVVASNLFGAPCLCDNRRSYIYTKGLILTWPSCTGDILTDLSGAITGSLGLNPSANLNVARDYPSVGLQRRLQISFTATCVRTIP